MGGGAGPYSEGWALWPGVGVEALDVWDRTSGDRERGVAVEQWVNEERA